MYKNILIPIAGDHGGTTREAMAAARFLADPDAKLTALTVVETVPGHVAAELPAGLIERAREAAEAHLRELVGDTMVPVVVTGHAARTINEYAAEHGIDCIVVASHRPGLADYFLGSTAAHVVRHAPCAVHVVR